MDALYTNTSSKLSTALHHTKSRNSTNFLVDYMTTLHQSTGNIYTHIFLDPTFYYLISKENDLLNSTYFLFHLSFGTVTIELDPKADVPILVI